MLSVNVSVSRGGPYSEILLHCVPPYDTRLCNVKKTADTTVL